MVQLSYPYMATGKTIAFSIQTFVGWAPEGLLIPLLLELLGFYRPVGGAGEGLRSISYAWG